MNTQWFKVISKENYGIVVDENARAKEGLNYNYGLKKLEKLDRNYESFSSEWQFCRKVIYSIGKRLDGVPLIELADDVENLLKQ